MAETNSQSPGSDIDAKTPPLFRMSTTAGLTGGESYVAVNPVAVVSLVVGMAGILPLFFGYILLIIPIGAIILAIMAIRQIRDSNGTQEGTWMAALGIILALGFSALVVGPDVMSRVTEKPDRDAIKQLIVKFGESLHNSNPDAAYDLMSGRFRARVPQPAFASFVKAYNANELWGKVDRAESNGQLLIRTESTIKARVAEGMARIIFVPVGSNPAAEDRMPMRFENQDGEWKIHDLAEYFPFDRFPAPGSQPPGGAPAVQPAGTK